MKYEASNAPKLNYNWSNNYSRLKALLDSGETVIVMRCGNSYGLCMMNFNKHDNMYKFNTGSSSIQPYFGPDELFFYACNDYGLLFLDIDKKS